MEGTMGNYNDKENNVAEYDTQLDLCIIREDLAAELLSMNQYQEHIEALSDQKAIELLQKIRDSKKKHIAQLFQLVQRLDGVQIKNKKEEHS
jgi:hypothetical protein